MSRLINLARVTITKVFRYQETFDADNTHDPDLEAAKQQLFRDFKAYLLAGRHVANLTSGQFGRDEFYDHVDTPASVRQAGLRHVHLLPVSALDRVKRRRKYDATSDEHIVYCIDDVRGYACALALIKPGHALARNAAFLVKLAQIAEQFYDR